MTSSTNDRLHMLRQNLQAQAERHTEELTRLTVHGIGAEDKGVDPQTLTAFIVSARQALADTSEALKRMTDGTYGRCQGCQRDIPVDRLEILPHAHFCVPCQQT